MGDDCVYPGFSTSFIPSGCYTQFGGDSFEAGEGVTAKGLLCVGWMGHNEDSLLLGTEKALLIGRRGRFLHISTITLPL
jgi:hypothetical protein